MVCLPVVRSQIGTLARPNFHSYHVSHFGHSRVARSGVVAVTETFHDNPLFASYGLWVSLSLFVTAIEKYPTYLYCVLFLAGQHSRSRRFGNVDLRTSNRNLETATLIFQILFFTAAALLVHTSLFYPCIAFLIGRARRESSSGSFPAVSVLVPAHNEASVIAAKIANFRTLDYPPESIELIIADDGSEDATADLVRQNVCERSRMLTISERSGKANAMNELVRASQFPVLLFTDANVMLQPDAVKMLVGHLADQRVGAVTGEVRLFGSDKEFAAGESFYYLLERRIQGAESRLGTVMGVDGGMYLLRKELYQPMPIDTILDDFLVSMIVMRAHRRIVYDGQARALESGTPTVRQEFARRVRIAAGAVQLLKRGQVPQLGQPLLWLQFFSHKLLRWFAPALLAILFISSLLLIKQGLLFQIAFICQFCVYLAIVVVYLVSPLRTNGVGGVLFYLGMSQIAIVVGLHKGLFNRQPPLWEKGRRMEECES